MTIRCCISALLLLVATHVAAGRSPGTGLQTPDRFTPDSTRIAGPDASERTQRLYDSIRSKTSRRAVPRMLYQVLFTRPAGDASAAEHVRDESRELAPHAGKTIGRIDIERLQPFDPGGNWLERTGNRLHLTTRDRVIRRDLLLEPGDRLDPELVVRNKQLLRSRSYIADIDIEVVPDPLDSTQVDLRITTRDSWTITADAGIGSEGRTMIGLYDANVFGTGNTLRVKTHFNRKDFSYGGNLIEYEIPNVLGTFYTAELAAGRNFFNSTFRFELSKEFIRPTDYELGASYDHSKTRRYMIEQDTSLLVRMRNFDLWGGYAHLLPRFGSSFYVTGHYNYRYVGRRPAVAPGYNPALHHQHLLLGAVGLYREKFYTTQMIYGFGQREYLATGYKAELTAGCLWGEFGNAMYVGASYRAGGFHSTGYYLGGIALGSCIDPSDGMWQRSAVDVDLSWFSNLLRLRRSRVRQFLALNYTLGWNRQHGSDESIRFTRTDGLHALKERVTGTNRLVMNTETVFFTPYQPLGFRIALFGFADFGLLGYSSNLFRNDFFTSLGLGVRLRNERLIFNTVQLRLGVALGKRGLVGSEYFRISNSTRVEQLRYRPTRPEIVDFR